MTRPGNNFALLRLVAALMVLWGHAFVLAGQPAPRVFGMEVHVLAVHVFFAISGYLVAGSWVADPHVLRYAARRALRIMPALAATVLLTVLVLGPVFSALGPAAYLAHPETRTYLWNLLLAPYFALPGVFTDGRPFTAVNGSLWTLPVEAAMYVLAPVLALAARRRAVLLSLLGAALLAAVLFAVLRPNQVQPVVWWTSLPFASRFLWDFAAAAAIRLWRLERLLHPSLVLSGLALLALLSFAGPGFELARGSVLLLLLPCAVLVLGLARLPLPEPGRADLSYGIYLWGGPVQQAALSLLGLGLGAGWLFGVSLAGSGLLAWLSWHGVERPCLRLKPRRPPPAPPPSVQPPLVSTGAGGYQNRPSPNRSSEGSPTRDP